MYKNKAIKFQKLYKNDKNVLEHLKVTNVQLSASVYGIKSSTDQEIKKLESKILLLEEEVENLRISNIELANQKQLYSEIGGLESENNSLSQSKKRFFFDDQSDLNSKFCKNLSNSEEMTEMKDINDIPSNSNFPGVSHATSVDRQIASNRSIDVSSPTKHKTFTELGLHIPERNTSASKPVSPLVKISSGRNGGKKSSNLKDIQINIDLDYRQGGLTDLKKTVKNGSLQNLTKNKINKSLSLKNELETIKCQNLNVSYFLKSKN